MLWREHVHFSSHRAGGVDHRRLFYNKQPQAGKIMKGAKQMLAAVTVFALVTALVMLPQRRYRRVCSAHVDLTIRTHRSALSQCILASSQNSCSHHLVAGAGLSDDIDVGVSTCYCHGRRTVATAGRTWKQPGRDAHVSRHWLRKQRSPHSIPTTLHPHLTTTRPATTVSVLQATAVARLGLCTCAEMRKTSAYPGSRPAFVNWAHWELTPYRSAVNPS
jgi:hypothetical protein